MRTLNLESLTFPPLLHCFFLHQYPHVSPLHLVAFFTSSCVPNYRRCLYSTIHVLGLRGYLLCLLIRATRFCASSAINGHNLTAYRGLGVNFCNFWRHVFPFPITPLLTIVLRSNFYLTVTLAITHFVISTLIRNFPSESAELPLSISFRNNTCAVTLWASVKDPTITDFGGPE